ncbi:MAG: hypothetical protein IT497_00175 [Ottowia sp.]|nr:hypothetical protein [Ottowia sp.]
MSCYLWISTLLPTSVAIAQVMTHVHPDGTVIWDMTAKPGVDTRPLTKPFSEADWIEHCVDTNCVTKVSAPRINWSEVARAPSARLEATIDHRNVQGDGWITRANEAAGMLGLSADQVSNAVFRGAGQRPIVVAHFLAEKNMARIYIYKVQHRPSGMNHVMVGDFSPHFGESWAAKRYFMSEHEKGNYYDAGNNPFASNRGANTDPVFYNMSWAAVQVAVGRAMIETNAGIGVIVVPKSRFDQRTHTSGNWFRKRTKTTIDAYTKPLWFIASPVELQPRGQIAVICAVNESPCDAGHRVSSGVSVEQWRGGSLPGNEDHTYHWEKSSSSFSVLTVALVVAVVVTGGAMAAGLPLFAAAGGAAAHAGTATIGAASIGTASGAIYATSQTALAHGGPVSQADPIFSNARQSYAAPNNPGSEQAQGLANNLEQQVIKKPMNQGLSAIKEWYLGNCPAEYQAGQCRLNGMDPGNIPRPDSWNQPRITQQLRDRYDRCVLIGHAPGVAAAKCAAPDASSTIVETTP